MTLIISTYTYQKGFEDGKTSHIRIRGYVSPLLDGKIEYDEWSTASLYMYPQYIKFNASGSYTNWNYLSVGQDKNNLYIAIDMVSITSPLIQETLGIYLILNGKYFETFSQFMILRDWGVEVLMYDVTRNVTLYDDEKNTIQNAIISMTYSSSMNSNTLHRQIEISIQKEEMRYYDSHSEIGLLIIGKYEGGEYYFAASSLYRNITYYSSSLYIGINLGNNEKIYV